MLVINGYIIKPDHLLFYVESTNDLINSKDCVLGTQYNKDSYYIKTKTRNYESKKDDNGKPLFKFMFVYGVMYIQDNRLKLKGKKKVGVKIGPGMDLTGVEPIEYYKDKVKIGTDQVVTIGFPPLEQKEPVEQRLTEICSDGPPTTKHKEVPLPKAVNPDIETLKGQVAILQSQISHTVERHEIMSLQNRVLKLEQNTCAKSSFSECWNSMKEKYPNLELLLFIAGVAITGWVL